MSDHWLRSFLYGNPHPPRGGAGLLSPFDLFFLWSNEFDVLENIRKMLSTNICHFGVLFSFLSSPWIQYTLFVYLFFGNLQIQNLSSFVDAWLERHWLAYSLLDAVLKTHVQDIILIPLWKTIAPSTDFRFTDRQFVIINFQGKNFLVFSSTLHEQLVLVHCLALVKLVVQSLYIPSVWNKETDHIVWYEDKNPPYIRSTIESQISEKKINTWVDFIWLSNKVKSTPETNF